MSPLARINFNMGCFEIVSVPSPLCGAFLINFNMGCFEMRKTTGNTTSKIGLTLTWDVLKLKTTGFDFVGYKINFNMGCFEIHNVHHIHCRNRINFNMGCFEISPKQVHSLYFSD